MPRLSAPGAAGRRGRSSSIDPATLGERLRAARIGHGLTLRQAADRSGLSRAFLSQVERGEVSPSVASLTKIAEALEIHLAERRVHERPALGVPPWRGHQVRDRAHQRDEQLLGPAGSVRRHEEERPWPRALGLDPERGHGGQADALARANRITYVGELGWELLVPADRAVHVYDALMAAAEGLGVRHVGYHALNSLRIEKAYRHMGHDITDEDSPLEAGLGFAVAWAKPGGFIGREALLRQRDAGLRRRLVTFTLDDPEPLLYHNEPIWRDGTLVGRTTSGWYGHTLGRSIALGYVEADAPGGATRDWLLGGRYKIEIATERFAATPTLRPPYDPDGGRIRG